MNFSKKQVLIIGLGDTGLSMALYLAHVGTKIRVADTRLEPPMAKQLLEKLPGTVIYTGAFRSESFKDIDAIAISPGIDRRTPIIAKAINQGIPVVGDIELFAQGINKPQSTKPKLIGITGSNGKSTVTTLVGEMCKQAGKRTVVAGNIGIPILNVLLENESVQEQPEVYVLELSSFQLESTSSLYLDAATVLNISEDHMDRYPNIAAYIAAKARIFSHAKNKLVNRDDSHTLTLAKNDKLLRSFGLSAPSNDTEYGVTDQNGQKFLAVGKQALIAMDEIPLPGLHNTANVLAALALASAINLPIEPLLKAVKNFKGLPHRVEKVAEINGVTYYDDSKGTNVGATLAALSGLGSPVVLIAGGDGKGQDFSPLKDAVGKQARAVVLIGQDAALIESAICASQVPIEHSPSLEDAVRRSSEIAQSGDAVLLSPACASFDMFRNYAHRAEVFIDAVKALQENGKKQHVL